MTSPSAPLRVLITRLAHGQGLPLPAYATPGAAGADLHAAEDAALPPGAHRAVATGFAIALPEGWEAQVRARSGLAAKHGVGLSNGVGTIDADYRGEIKVLLFNAGAEEVAIRRGERIAQLVLAPVVRATWEECDSLPESERASGGFGSTGR